MRRLHINEHPCNGMQAEIDGMKLSCGTIITVYVGFEIREGRLEFDGQTRYYYFDVAGSYLPAHNAMKLPDA